MNMLKSLLLVYISIIHLSLFSLIVSFRWSINQRVICPTGSQLTSWSNPNRRVTRPFDVKGMISSSRSNRLGVASSYLSSSSSSSSGGKEKEKDNAEELVNELKGTCIFLVGLMGSGKTAVGSEIARKLGYRFIDTDEIAEYMIEMPIADFFAEGKEEDFRTLEKQILNEMSQYIRVVISTGGGVVMKNENW